MLLTKRCVYCLANAELDDDQVLLRGRHLYLCAPRGQLIEGYLAIAPYRCIGSLSQLPAWCFAELDRLKRTVEGFYLATYQVATATFYEQGRAGGGAVVDEAGGFPLHAHLCCLPVSLDLHTALAGAHRQRRLAGPHELPVAARGGPYVYVESLDALGGYRRSVYLGRSEQTRRQLEGLRLKPEVAALMGLPGRGDWRAYPGDRELQRIVAKFASWARKGSVMAEPIEEEAREIKRLARAHRDSGDPAAAVTALREGIQRLKAALAGAGEGEAALAVQLADLYGMLGGALRGQGDQLGAAAAYDAGFRLESDPRYAMPSTYTTLNRLVTRVLLRPSCLTDPEVLRREPDLEFVDVRQELTALQPRLQEQVAGARAGDFWAAGDLSVACALNGDEAGMRQGLERFLRLSPPPEAHDAYRATIGALAAVDTPSRDTLRAAEAAWSG